MKNVQCGFLSVIYILNTTHARANTSARLAFTSYILIRNKLYVDRYNSLHKFVGCNERIGISVVFTLTLCVCVACSFVGINRYKLEK